MSRTIRRKSARVPYWLSVKDFYFRDGICVDILRNKKEYKKIVSMFHSDSWYKTGCDTTYPMVAYEVIDLLMIEINRLRAVELQHTIYMSKYNVQSPKK